MTMSTTPVFLSAPSANALISELRPTTLSQPALQHINALIDEILHLLISSSQSLNPAHIRKEGITAVFAGDKLAGDSTGPRALGRSAVAEAELELRSWYDSHPGAKRGAFAPEGKGTGIKGDRAFPVKEATELLKLKCVSFSTLAPTTPPSEAYEFQITEAWKAVGGDDSDNTLSPSGLWVTAILEHVCEHVLRQLSRVVARDSSIAVAGVQDLYVALCEDESIWGLFKRLQVKESLESAIKAGTRRKNPIPHSQSQNLLGSSIHSKTSIPTSASLRDTSIDQSRHSSSTPVEHIVNHPAKGPVAAVARAVSSSTHKSHNRSPSTLSNNTKTLVTAFQDQYDTENQRRPSADEDEFDALVRSGETMKVSLTPSRLKNFDMSPNRRAPPSPTQNKYVRAVRPTQSPEIQESGTMPPPLPTTGLDHSKKQMHARSSSGQRLVARNAATIKEHENEEDEELLDGPKGKKESLADMFASEPKGKERRTSGGTGKRVVPAVVLGSPPPQESSTIPNNDDSIGRKTKRSDLMVSTAPQQGSVRSTTTAKSTATPKPRGRSEAQELADFFSSTEPPPDTLAPPSPIHEEPPKSAKSFKSFMSRMTGKKGSKENERPPMPSAFSQAPPTGVKRQKSFGSFKSNSNPTSPPLGNAESFSPMMNTSNSFTSPPPVTTPPDRGVSAFTSPRPGHVSSFNPTSQPNEISPKSRGIPAFATQPQPIAPSPSKDRGALHAAGNDARSGQDLGADKVLAAGVAALSMGAGQQTKIVSPERRMEDKSTDQRSNDDKKEKEREYVVDEASRDINSIPTEAGTGQMTGDKLPPPRPPRATGTSQRSIRPVPKDIPMLAPPLSTAADEYVVVNKSDAYPTPIITNSTLDADNTSPIRATPSTAAQSHFASDAVSFRTASEGTTPPQQEEETRTHDKTLVDDTNQSNNTPSIPLSELIPLRGLLQHATSARECQLLLSAILSQLGIPHSDSSRDEVIDPESRVTAWLLAGREGPIDYPSIQSPRSTTATGTSQSQMLGTPTLTNADLDVGTVAVQGQGEGGAVRTELRPGFEGGVKVNGNVETGTNGEEREGWAGAVRIPGDREDRLVRDEVIGS